jgi:hypothetical protein
MLCQGAFTFAQKPIKHALFKLFLNRLAFVIHLCNDHYIGAGQPARRGNKMNGQICVACGTTQAIKENGNYFLGNNIDAVITGTIELCVICEIAGVPEKEDA